MGLTVHHLQRGQSERVLWLCEELQIPYTLKNYARDPETMLAPPELKALHPTGSAPVIQDGAVTLAESGAVVEYILTKYGHGKLQIKPSAHNYPDYIYWLHFANGTLQPSATANMMIAYAGVSPTSPSQRGATARLHMYLAMLDERTKDNTWLAGEEFTAADIMIVFSLTTTRLFFPIGLQDYPGVQGYLQRVGQREGYQKAMAKGDPGFTPVLGAEPPEPFKPPRQIS